MPRNNREVANTESAISLRGNECSACLCSKCVKHCEDSCKYCKDKCYEVLYCVDRYYQMDIFDVIGDGKDEISI